MYAADTLCEPAVRPVTSAVAAPLTSVALYVVVSTVKTTVPAGVTDEPVTVALSVTGWPNTGDAGEKVPRLIVEAGGVAGPVRVSCTEEGLDNDAFAKLPLNVTASVVVTKVVGVYAAESAQTPPIANVPAPLAFNVQSVEDVGVRL